MKTTPLTKKHIALGAKMTDFAGYQMPVSYKGIKEEHLAVRNNVGVFDVSHMGEFIIRGKQALDLIQQVTSNDAAKLEIGGVQYSCLPNHDGGIVDDLLIYRLPEDQCAADERAYMLVVNASNIQKDWDWIKQHSENYEVEMLDISKATGLLAVQGPNAVQALQSLTDMDLTGMKYYTFDKGVFAGLDKVLVSATGYTGSGGFEIYARNEQLEQIWDAIFEAGKDLDIQPIGLGARDTLRLEKGFCLYGNDIDDSTSPLEAGLGWITKLKKGDFNSKAIFEQQKKEGLQRKLVGFTLEGRRVPRHDYVIEDMEGNTIGKVTSGTQSPSLEQPVGMGYVKTAFSKSGTAINIAVGKKRLKAVVARPPFVK